YAGSINNPGSVYIGNVSETGAQTADPTTNLGILNKITSTTAYDAALVSHPGSTNISQYSLANNKQYGIFIGGADGHNNLASFDNGSQAGVFIGYQYQPLSNGYGSSLVFSAKDDSSNEVEIMRLLGRDGNVGIGTSTPSAKLHVQG